MPVARMRANGKEVTMLWTDIPAGSLNAAQQRLLVALGNNAGKVVDRMKTDPDFVKRVTLFMESGGYEPLTLQKIAREIMGTNFFGVEEAAKYLGVNPSKRQLGAFANVPWNEEVLRACKDTHVLVAVFPLSILGIKKEVSDRLGNIFSIQRSLNNNASVKKRCKIGWKLVRKTPFEDSTYKTWDEQQTLVVLENEEVPSAQLMVYTASSHYLATGEQLFKQVTVRTSSTESNGNRINVGNGEGGLIINSWWNDNSCFGNLGVSSIRKPGKF